MGVVKKDQKRAAFAERVPAVRFHVTCVFDPEDFVLANWMPPVMVRVSRSSTTSKLAVVICVSTS